MSHLHYIGTTLYTRDKFVKEARTKGVNRSIPLFVLRIAKVEFGDRILLAQYETRKTKTETVGLARAFGYFNVHALNFSCEKKADFMARLRTQLDVVHTDNSSAGKQVSRQCGSYALGPTLIVNDSLQEILQKASILANEMGVKPKVFLAGPYNALRHDKVMSPIRFSRTLLSVDFSPPEIIDGKTKKKVEQEIGFLDNYERKKYTVKGAKA